MARKKASREIPKEETKFDLSKLEESLSQIVNLQTNTLQKLSNLEERVSGLEKGENPIPNTVILVKEKIEEENIKERNGVHFLPEGEVSNIQRVDNTTGLKKLSKKELEAIKAESKEIESQIYADKIKTVPTVRNRGEVKAEYMQCRYCGKKNWVYPSHLHSVITASGNADYSGYICDNCLSSGRK